MYQLFRDTGSPKASDISRLGSGTDNHILVVDLRKLDDDLIYDYFKGRLKREHQLYKEALDAKGLGKFNVVFRNYLSYEEKELVSEWLQEDFFQKRIENFYFEENGLLSICLRKSEVEYKKLPNNRLKPANEYIYLNGNYETDPLKRENGLINNFLSPPYKNKEEYPAFSLPSEKSLNPYFYPDEESWQAEEDNDTHPVTSFKNCPAIDLSFYENGFTSLESRIPKIDLHPVYNKNFKEYLRNKIFRMQKAYHLSETTVKKIYIITGTGKNRPGPDYSLQKTVNKLLGTDYFRRRIAFYRLEKEGLFAVFLRKNIRKARK